MTFEKQNTGVSFLEEKIKNILKSKGPANGKLILILLLSDPDVNKYRVDMNDRTLEKLLELAFQRLLRNSHIYADLSFDLENTDSKTLYYLHGQMPSKVETGVAKIIPKSPRPL